MTYTRPGFSRQNTQISQVSNTVSENQECEERFLFGLGRTIRVCRHPAPEARARR